MPVRLTRSVTCRSLIAASMLAAGIFFASPSQAQFQVELVAGGLNHPIFATHAPGDPDGLYIVEQRNGGFGSSLTTGTIRRLDLTNGTMTTFLTVSGLDTDTQGGLHAIAFHPDYQPGVEGSKFYIIAMRDPAQTLLQENHLEEWVINASGDPEFSRLILKTTSLITNDATHQMDWCGFRPTAMGPERNWLYITHGDGGIQAGSNSFVNNPQDLASMYGKLLRIDISGEDAYPADPDRNYGLTPTLYNGDNDTNDGVPGVTAPEVYYSGMRNPWRASFDRLTGDFWYGDIGRGSWEEINFVPGGVLGLDSNGNPADPGDGAAYGIGFGWARREGLTATQFSGGGDVDPDGPGIRPPSVEPVKVWSHSGSPENGAMYSVTGGYVYRGPQQHPAIQGKYIFGAFMTGRTYVGGFDDNDEFQWEDVTQQFIDSLAGTGRDIDHTASFAEDAAGNVYLIDFGDFGGNSQETGWRAVVTQFGTGQIYKISYHVEQLPGDTDGDGDIDDFDLINAIVNYTGALDPGVGGKTPADGDTDDDGDVDDFDLINMITGYTGSIAAPGKDINDL